MKSNQEEGFIFTNSTLKNFLVELLIEPGRDDRDDEVARYLRKAGEIVAVVEDITDESANDAFSSILLSCFPILSPSARSVSAPKIAVSVSNESANDALSMLAPEAYGKSTSGFSSLLNSTPC